MIAQLSILLGVQRYQLFYSRFVSSFFIRLVFCCKLLMKFIVGAFNNTFGFVISLFF